ncbi:hypothetical protein GCM10020220_099250 [Nonomuraea rubra]|uniref:hypothetical protein n=1 Tax=Nonomuraea rubra TaxID=46180 RepID=UPI0031E5ADFE
MDEIELVFDEKPYVPEVSFPGGALTADRVGNLVTALNAAAVLPAGARIVQARYTSDNAAVLPSSGDRFAPRATSPATAARSSRLQQLKLHQNGVTFTVDQDVSLRLRVRNLPPRVDVTAYLKGLTGRGMLAAMHHDQSYADPLNADVLHQRVANQFGVYPALYSADFLTGGTVPYRQNMIDEVRRQWAGGGLVQIMFHVSPPQYTVAQERLRAAGAATRRTRRCPARTGSSATSTTTSGRS